jgi:hypothetical protein
MAFIDARGFVAAKAVPVRQCVDCGAPISAYSRGRCEPCAYLTMRRPMPEDFMIILKRLGSAGAARHYRSSLSTITKWRRDLEIRPNARAKKPTARRTYPTKCNINYQHREWTRPAQAAYFLQRFDAVFRCDEHGHVPKKGEALFWYRNGRVLTDDEIMAKAARLGWKPVSV